MNNDFSCYLEDYHEIKMIVPTSFDAKAQPIHFVSQGVNVPITIYKEEIISNKKHLWGCFYSILSLHQDSYVSFSPNLITYLHLGKITRSLRFEEENNYHGPLGIFYSTQSTRFYLWAPVAKEVILVVGEKEYPLNSIENGAWTIEVMGDLEKKEYYYKVRNNQHFHQVVDPYAFSSTSNGEKGIIVDLEKTKLEEVVPSLVHNPIIEEVHVRDFSSLLPVLHPGSYLGLLESQQFDDKGILELKKMGVTDIQFQPLNLFGGVLEDITSSKDSCFLYNWGYNPVLYFTPSGWYSSDAKNPYARITECKKMIFELKKMGFRINLDVVFNHVYDAESFSYAKLAPGYFFHYKKDGFLENASYCGNDLATNRSMVRRMILDSLVFWQNEYQIDGFRFDLMGLMDVETLRQAKAVLEKKNPNVFLYGEGWNMANHLPPLERANLDNQWRLKDFAFFNDTFRNFCRPSLDGCFFGKKKDNAQEMIAFLLSGCSKNEKLFTSNHQSLNYVECHDNQTYFDYLDGRKDLTIEQKKDYARLAIELVFVSFGIPFLHLGQENLSTKNGLDNSYLAGDAVNGMNWDRFKQFDYRTIIQALSEFRKKHEKLYSLDFNTSVRNNFSVTYRNGLYECRILMPEDDLVILIKTDYARSEYYFSPGTYCVYDHESVNYKVESEILLQPGVKIYEHR